MTPASSGERIPAAWSPLEAALIAFHDRGERAEVLVSSYLGDPPVLQASLFFRTEGEIEKWESVALERCGEHVLDVGAGVGAHALILQGRGHRVTALETLPGAVRIMEERGVKDARVGTLFDLPDEATYDTVLILMNGSMLAETLSGLDSMLERVLGMIHPGGSLLFDSTDLRLSDDPSGGYGRYVGELHFQLSYGGLRGEVCLHLFVDPDTLQARTHIGGWETRVIWEGTDGRFLAQLSPT